jgi:imidazolonepropionase
VPEAPLADLVLRDARLLTQEPRGVIARGWIAARNGRIVALGEGDPHVRARRDAIERPLRGRVVLPGFVDAHTHLLYAGERYDEFVERRTGTPYLEILRRGGGIHRTVADTRAASDARLAALLRDRIARAAAQGTTTIEVKSGYGLAPAEELRHLRVIARVRREAPIEVVPTYLALHALPPGADRASFVADAAGAVATVARERLAERVDAFVDEGVFSTTDASELFRAARAAGLSLALHADQFTDAGGAALAAGFGALSADHLTAADERGLAAMARAGTIAVLLPGSALLVGYAPPDARRFRGAGVRMALATDQNPGTSPLEGMPMAIALGVNLCGLTPAEALSAATVNGAAALGREREIGSLRVGKRADLVVLDSDDERDLAYRVGARLIREVYAAGRRVRV